MVLSESVHFRFRAKGHGNILATHASTFEVTMEPHLTQQGDCIIAVNSTHTARHLNFILGDALRQPNSQIHTTLSVGDTVELVKGHGSPHLPLSSTTSIVWRTSGHIDERTIAIHCDKSAKNINRIMVEMLQNPETTLQVAISVFLEST